MEMKDIIKTRRLELGLTQQELADRCHADRSTVGKWESGDIVNIKRDKLRLLASVLEVSHLALLGAEEYVPTQKDKIIIYDAIYGDKLGNPIDDLKNPYPEQVGNYFGIKVEHPTFPDNGCYVIFNKDQKVQSGDIVAVSLNAEQAIVRKLYLVDKDIVTLRPVLGDGELINLVGNDVKNMNVLGKYSFTITPFIK